MLSKLDRATLVLFGAAIVVGQLTLPASGTSGDFVAQAMLIVILANVLAVRNRL